MIPLSPDRSALLDVKNRVLLLTITRLLSRFDVELSVALHLLSESDVCVHFDPLNGNPCLAFEDIPNLLSAIRPPQRNDRHNRQYMHMTLAHAGLAITMKFSDLLNQPRALSRELIVTMQDIECMEEEKLKGIFDFMHKVAVR
jgi:hypothetical protein